MKWFNRDKTDDEPKFLTCKYCDMKFEDKERLKRHTRKAHSEKRRRHAKSLIHLAHEIHIDRIKHVSTS